MGGGIKVADGGLRRSGCLVLCKLMWPDIYHTNPATAQYPAEIRKCHQDEVNTSHSTWWEEKYREMPTALCIKPRLRDQEQQLVCRV